MLKVPDRATDMNRVEFVIVLVKRTNLHGDAHVGRKFRWTYKHVARDLAIHRAFAALVRDLPGESRRDWAVAEDG